MRCKRCRPEMQQRMLAECNTWVGLTEEPRADCWPWPPPAPGLTTMQQQTAMQHMPRSPAEGDSLLVLASSGTWLDNNATAHSNATHAAITWLDNNATAHTNATLTVGLGFLQHLVHVRLDLHLIQVLQQAARNRIVASGFM